MTIRISYNIRLPAPDKGYWHRQLVTFAQTFNPALIKSVHYGKLDIRGAVQIVLFDVRGCVPHYESFPSAKELLAFVQGYNAARNAHNRFQSYEKSTENAA